MPTWLTRRSAWVCAPHWARATCSHFLGLVQVDGTEVTCQVASSQKAVACDVGYPALKTEQQVQVALRPQTHAGPPQRSVNSPTDRPPHQASPFRGSTDSGCCSEEAFKIGKFSLSYEKSGISPCSSFQKAHALYAKLVFSELVDRVGQSAVNRAPGNRLLAPDEQVHMAQSFRSSQACVPVPEDACPVRLSPPPVRVRLLGELGR